MGERAISASRWRKWWLMDGGIHASYLDAVVFFSFFLLMMKVDSVKRLTRSGGSRESTPSLKTLCSTLWMHPMRIYSLSPHNPSYLERFSFTLMAPQRVAAIVLVDESVYKLAVKRTEFLKRGRQILLHFRHVKP